MIYSKNKFLYKYKYKNLNYNVKNILNVLRIVKASSKHLKKIFLIPITINPTTPSLQ
jgi:hypothetical protein